MLSFWIVSVYKRSLREFLSFICKAYAPLLTHQLLTSEEMPFRWNYWRVMQFSNDFIELDGVQDVTRFHYRAH